MPTPADEARRRAIAEDPLLAPSMRVRTEYIDRKLSVLRTQMLFLFAFLVAGLVVMGIFFRNQDQEIRLDRYLGCTQRAADIRTYNAGVPEGIPGFPLPICPPDPRLN